MIYLKRTFHPVGQGAFFTEQFYDGAMEHVLYNVVYDCGSKSPGIRIQMERILKHWADYQFLQKLNCREFHVYDNDVAKYQETVDAINARGDGSYATMTLKREIENYLHKDAIKQEYDVDVETDSDEVPKRFGAVYAAKMGWQGLKDNNAKTKLSNVFKHAMTYELLMDRDKVGEIKGWFDKIEGML